MRDFTFNTYCLYLEEIKARYKSILRFDEYFRLKMKPNSFAMIRHDVDRRPLKALHLAQIENKMGIRSTYYFRIKSHVFKPSIIKAIRRLGHDIGYHYETLADANGDYALALKWFGRNLKKMRMYSQIDTICMHGRPLSHHNNLDLWRKQENHSRLKSTYKILGEIYLDIVYQDIAYISDTGRNWEQQRSNMRDVVDTDVATSLKNGRELLDALRNKRWKKIVFQTHPERWSENEFEHVFQFIIDTGVNMVKKLL